ncbi:metallophosphoesterase [Bacillus paranthracis]|uniref:metallophosphoesterase n=1 Tax=Bacillus paranthracis TaxID=2026186 RepID=UPI003D6579B7
MRAIHLSDFHISKENLSELKNYILNPLINDLKDLHSQKEIDFIFFTGDLIDKGGASFESIAEAFKAFEVEVIDYITSELGIPKERFIINPGNHDILRTADDSIQELGLKSYFKDLNAINDFMKNKEQYSNSTKRIHAYNKFEEELYKNSLNTNINYFETVHKYTIGGCKIGITSLNSSWRCYDNEDSGNLLISEKQIMDSVGMIEDCDVKVALIHHPIKDLSTVEQKLIKSRLNSSFDLLLFGHVHNTDTYQFSDMTGTSINSVSPSAWTENRYNTDYEYLNGYVLIDYEYANCCTFTYRCYSNIKNAFITNTQLGMEEGKSFFSCPNKTALESLKKKEKIIQRLDAVYTETVNEHLLTYNTDTIAPKKLNDLFVMPKIVQKNEDFVEEDVSRVSDKNFSMQDICKSKENIMLVGVKEAGKTILLDKIMIEYLNNFSFHEKIPVYLDFEEINGSSIDTLIARFTTTSIREIRDETFNINDIVLLIDNIQFENKHSSSLNKLTRFILNNSNVRIITTCTSNGEGELPLSAIGNSILEHFCITYIKQFNTKDIQTLMSKWFIDRSEVTSKKEHLDKVISTFNALNIPRTPLAVSMFLWIIEKQENYSPVNNAQMLENFLERLFSKSDTYEVYSADFTYKNKESLLTDIAYEMYSNKKIRYRLSYGELRDYIEQNLKEKMFDFDADIILTHFLNKGVFTCEMEESIKYVRFKFSCFFQFYLMKSIDSNQEFKDYILTDRNYLNFIDELDYYTGLKMNQLELVEKIVNNMNEDYKDVKKKVTHLGIDTFFETKHTIVSKLTTEKVEGITLELKKNDDYYETKDRELENHTSRNIEVKPDSLNPVQQLERNWVLAAKMLKNSEEIRKKDFKVNALNDIVLCATLFATLYKVFLTKQRNENKEQYMADEQNIVVYKLLPLIHQVILTQTIGTGKLLVALENIIENEQFHNKSELEQFTYVFLYADLKGKNKFSYIDQLLSRHKMSYLKDMVFFKVLEYYNRFDISTNEETKFKNYIGDLTVSKNPSSNPKINQIKKASIITKVEKEKIKQKLLVTT